MIPPHTNRYPKPPSGAATGWGRFFCVSDQGERAAAGGAAKPLRPRKLGQLPTAWGAFCAGKARERSLPSQGRWPRSRPEGFSPLTGSIAKPRAGHARPLRTAVNRCAREGQGRAVARPFAVGGWLTGNGRPRKARRDPSGLAGSASSPDGEPFAGCRPRLSQPLKTAGVRGNTRLKGGGRGGGVKNEK